MIRSTGSHPLAEPRVRRSRAGMTPRRLSWSHVVRQGAAAAAASVLVYALLFILYGGIRYTVALRAAPPDSGVWGTWATGLLSMAVATVTASLILLLPAVLVGLLTALIVAGLASLLRWTACPRRIVLLGLVVALGIVLLVHLPLFQTRLLGWRGLLSATYLFWLGLPSVVYVAATAVQSRRLPCYLVTAREAAPSR